MTDIWNDNGKYSVRVDGDWVACTVTEHLQQVALQSLRISDRALHYVAGNPDEHIVTEIDLNGITSIDSSGFSILALWLRHLQKHGFYPVAIHEDANFISRINADVN